MKTANSEQSLSVTIWLEFFSESRPGQEGGRKFLQLINDLICG